MTNWLVTLINTNQPFEKKKVIIHADTVVEALGKGDKENAGYYARSACFHSTYHSTDYNQALVEQESGYGWGPV